MGCIQTKKKPSHTAPTDFLSKLKTVPFLNSLSQDELRSIAGSMIEQTFEIGEYLMKEGEMGDEFFIILSGLCTVDTTECGLIAELHPGDYCGEQALLTNCVRTASIKAKTQCQCVKLDQKAFNDLLGEQSKIKFAHRSAKRAAILTNNDEPVRDYDRMSTVKSGKTISWLLECIATNMLFETMQEDERAAIVERMHKHEVEEGTSMIIEGQEGDEFYVIESGQFEVLVGGEQVGMLEPNSCCGELALMYDAPRAATVKAVCNSVVWVVQRSAFRGALTEMYKFKDAQHIELLRTIDTFQSMLTNELTLVSDACEEIGYCAGEKIIQEGAVGNRFFMIMEGKAKWSKRNGETGFITEKYFGELALINNSVRKCSVVAFTDLKLLVLKRSDFTELLGPIENILKDRAKVYTKYSSSVKPEEKSNVCALHELKQLGTLGKGAFGFVTLVEDPFTSKTYALKAIRKTRIIEHNQESIIVREKRVMNQLNHHRLVNLRCTYKDECRVYLLLDACLGGELFNVLRKKRYFSERVAKFYAACVIEGFEYMHSKQIIYRDLKPENLVLQLDGYIKITDFGFAKITPEKTFTLCGTPDYLAPEIVTGQGHNYGVDWWTVGVFIYEMLASVSPFYNSDPLMMYRSIVRGKYKTPKYFSEEVSDLVNKLLIRRVTKRLGVIAGGISNIKCHAWYANYDWDLMSCNKLAAPFLPHVKDIRDVSNFKQITDSKSELKPAKLKFEDEF